MHHRPFCTPKPDADLCMRVDLKTRQKNCGKSGLVLDRGPQAASRWAFGPLGRRGPWAAGRWTFGPSGRWAVSGRGPWAAGPRACFYQNPYRVTLCMCSTAFRSEAKMSRQATLGRFGFEKSISHRTSVLETKVTDLVSTLSWKIECNHLKL